MMVWLVERRTLLIWRMVQFWTFLGILILEIVQLSRYQEYYWAYPANNQVRIWFSEGISFSLTGYMLFKLNYRWEDGPFKQDILLDWILFVIWIFQSFLNIAPVFSGKGLDCKLGSTNPYMITTPDNQTRCRLFLVSTGFSFFALFTTFVTLTLSTVRWKIRRDTKSSKSSTYHGAYNKPYLVQKGSLSNGEPVLFFYSKNKNGASYSPHLKNMSKSNIQPSVNISIPEPEIVATSKYSRDFTTNVLDNEKGETDDSVLKY